MVYRLLAVAATLALLASAAGDRAARAQIPSAAD
jgi:hypothetical protein